jgi:hypothetical protein
MKLAYIALASLVVTSFAVGCSAAYVSSGQDSGPFDIDSGVPSESGPPNVVPEGGKLDGESDALSQTPKAGFVFRGMHQVQSGFTKVVTLNAPDETVPGDLLWVALSVNAWPLPSVTLPVGFKQVNADSHACGSGGSSLFISNHVVTATTPKAFDFGLQNSVWVSAALLVFGGVSGTMPVETSSFNRVGSNPYLLPKLPGSNQGLYGIAIYAGVAGSTLTTFSTPPTTTRLFAGNGLAAFVRDVPAGGSFDVGPVNASPDTCGFFSGALLRPK